MYNIIIIIITIIIIIIIIQMIIHTMQSVRYRLIQKGDIQ